MSTVLCISLSSCNETVPCQNQIFLSLKLRNFPFPYKIPWNFGGSNFDNSNTFESTNSTYILYICKCIEKKMLVKHAQCILKKRIFNLKQYILITVCYVMQKTHTTVFILCLYRKQQQNFQQITHKKLVNFLLGQITNINLR